MNSHVAFLPISSRNSENLLNVFFSKKIVSWRHVVAKWWFIALLSDIIHIESWGNWKSKNSSDTKLAFFNSNWPNTSLDESLTGKESSLKNFVLSCTNKLILISESIILWVLEIWIDKSVSDGHTLEVELELVLVLEKEVVRNGWDVMSSITLTSDIEVFSLKLWILLEESLHESGHVFSDFVLVSD